MARKLIYLNSKDVRNMLEMRDAIKILKRSFKDFAIGRSVMPSKTYLDLPTLGGDFRAMSAYCARDKMVGLKWDNSYPANRMHKVPCVMGVMLLNDPATGIPLAVVEATELTNIRTGAAGAVAAQILSLKESQSLGFVGTGVQALYQAKGILEVRKIKKIYFYDPSHRASQKFEKDLQEFFDGEIISCEDVESCCQNVEILVTSTPSRKPVVKEEWIKPGTHINAIGADSPGKQELDFEILKKAKIVMDDKEQAIHSGEINVSVKRGLLSVRKLDTTLGDILTEKRKGRMNASQITVFDCTGMAVQDIALGAYLYERSTRAKTKTTLDLVGV